MAVDNDNLSDRRKWRSSAINKVGHSVLSTMCDGRTRLKTSVVWQVNEKNGKNARVWGKVNGEVPSSLGDRRPEPI